MNRIRYASLALVAAALAISLSIAAVAQKITQNIPYANGPQGPVLGDLYQPTGDGPFPAIIFLHGGSWRSGNRSDFRKLATDLAAKGYVGFSIDYDLNPHSFPVSWQEAEAAVRFLRRHAAEYGVDPNHIMIAGTSAGGELAALVALDPHGPATPDASSSAPSDDTSDTVSAALILNGVFDLDASAHVITRYLGGRCQDLEAVCKDASPLQHVHPGAPPFFVGHGTADHTVSFAEAQTFAAALRTDHVPVTFYTAKGGPHMYWTKKPFYTPNLKAMEDFLANVSQSSAPVAR